MTREIKKHTLETLLARTVEVGECYEWQGYVKNGTPQVSHGGKMMTVRRLMHELQGKSVKGYFLSPGCDNPLCVNPAHTVVRTTAAHLRRMNKNVNKGGLMRVARLQHAARGRRKLTDEQVIQIRVDPRPSRAVAAEHGVSKALVCSIRRGDARRLIATNPFAGLMR